MVMDPKAKPPLGGLVTVLKIESAQWSSKPEHSATLGGGQLQTNIRFGTPPARCEAATVE